MTFIIPFKGRNHSGTYDLNFLYQENNIFVMDNHRAAMWCWLQYFNSQSQNISLFHLDRHTDCLTANLNSWVQQSLSPVHVERMPINDYESKIDSQFNSPLYRWDNYASIFLGIYQNQIDSCRFVTYGAGDKPNHPNVLGADPWLLPDNIDFYMQDGEWICNIDLDYFCHEIDDDIKIMYSDEYIVDIFTKIKRLLYDKKIKVLTVCFSPECCGNWANSEKIWGVAQKCLKTNLVLP